MCVSAALREAQAATQPTNSMDEETDQTDAHSHTSTQTPPHTATTATTTASQAAASSTVASTSGNAATPQAAAAAAAAAVTAQNNGQKQKNASRSDINDFVLDRTAFARLIRMRKQDRLELFESRRARNRDVLRNRSPSMAPPAAAAAGVGAGSGGSGGGSAAATATVFRPPAVVSEPSTDPTNN